MLRPDSLGDRATLVARLARNPFRFDDAFARLLSVRVCIPLYELMSASIGDDNAAHAEPSLKRVLNFSLPPVPRDGKRIDALNRSLTLPQPKCSPAAVKAVSSCPDRG